MKRILLTVVTASALVLGGWLTGAAQAQYPSYGYGCRPGGVGLAVGYGYPGVNIAYRAPNVALYSPNVAYTSGFAGGYGYRQGCGCQPGLYGAGGYPYSRSRVNFYFGY
ncbi:MAG TPA: hypothetical protein VFB80_08695 [Pirellulaceae bacterium]|jgi:hypothetical protein|nr:hypothetical protein [Pirellulaceae bacterium]